ncbi:MAG: UDP-N-acetylmuramoyl-tripeptide--D-alanyl-D-alanine ligase [Aquificaceae bacterium]|nr:UDP-N-acetylmuramoyl-tripeptide--D-alanyl-D-alanine ligase [Aquificaceae bacterium]
MTTLELANLLGAKHIGQSKFFKGFSIDSRETKKGQVFVALKGKVHDGHDFAQEAVGRGAVAIICERPLKLSGDIPQLLVEDTHQALRRFASFCRERFKGKVIAVAGSAGKTTTKELIALLLSKVGNVQKTPRNLNSQVGVPISIANFEEGGDYWVVEMGASQKGDVKNLVELVKPNVRAITAIGEEHLETFGCLDDVVLGNGEIFHQIAEEDWGICPNYVSHCYQISRKLTFGGEDFNAEDVSLSLEGVRFRLKGCLISAPIPSLALVENILCAFRVLEALGLDWRELKECLRDFHPVEGRFRVLKKGELIIIDDTYNANPPSVRMALKSLSLFDGYRVAVLGDMLELGENSELYHREVGRMCIDLGLELCIFYGSYMKYAYEECLNAGIRCLFFEDPEQLTIFLMGLKKAVILFKGSRGMRMEKMVEGVLNG